MPVLETKGAISAQGFGSTLSSSGPANYIENFFSTWLYTGNSSTQIINNGIGLTSTGAWSSNRISKSSSARAAGVDVDSSGNLYVAYSLSADLITIKYSSTGTITWQNRLTDPDGGTDAIAKSVKVDSSGNVYVLGQMQTPVGSTRYGLVAKYNSSGTLQWQKKIAPGLSPATDVHNLTVDSSGNVYVTTSKAVVIKFSSAGATTWQRYLGDGTGTELIGLAVDGSGNVYVGGRFVESAVTKATFAKFDSSGTLQWQRKLQGFTGSTICYAVALDSGGNPYFVGQYGTARYNFVQKYDSSGAAQWIRRFNLSGANAGVPVGACFDSSDNLYVSGKTSNGTTEFAFAISYTSSGTVRWQTFFDLTTANGFGGYQSVVSSGSVFLGVGENYSGVVSLSATTGLARGILDTNLAALAGTFTTDTPGDTEAAGNATTANGSLSISAASCLDNTASVTITTFNQAAVTSSGGLVWFKRRNGAGEHSLFDTVRGATNYLQTQATTAQTTNSTSLTSFDPSGFTLGDNGLNNFSGETLASWTFRRQPKFFDVVTYTGNGNTGSGQQIAHNLGSTPGCIIIKSTSGTGTWLVYHRSVPSAAGAGPGAMFLNTTAARSTTNSAIGFTNATVFSVGENTATVSANTNGVTYVAYLFAHNAGGFGLSGTDNVITCGSYTGTGADGNTVTLGYEPQWLLIKNTSDGSAGSNWTMADSLRGQPVSTTQSYKRLLANAADMEEDGGVNLNPTATGFIVQSSSVGLNQSGNTYIYIAIRGGPMRTPTTGSSVFAPTTYTGNSSTQNIVNGVLNRGLGGLVITKTLAVAGLPNEWTDSLRGITGLSSTSTAAQTANSDMKGVLNNGFSLGFSTGYGNQSGRAFVGYQINRAPGFFDEVCYTGTSAAMNVAHNLTAVPELMIVKNRSATGGWNVYVASIGNTKYLQLNTSDSPVESSGRWNNTSPTSSVFTVGTFLSGSGVNYVNYLFASCPGVSKVGSYTGTSGVSQIVNCGFTSGARFVLIKSANVGNWYLWDSARGISASTDPYFLLNSTDAQITSTNWVDTDPTGFRLTNAGDTEVNLNVPFIFLAIA